MFLVNRTASFPKGTIAQYLLKKDSYELLAPLSSLTINSEPFQKTGFHEPLKRSFHVTKANRDIETGLRALGAGAAVCGLIGPGIGIGIVFGSFLTASARNPSISNKIFTATMMGGALCESIGLFAFMMGLWVAPS